MCENYNYIEEIPVGAYVRVTRAITGEYVCKNLCGMIVSKMFDHYFDNMIGEVPAYLIACPALTDTRGYEKIKMESGGGVLPIEALIVPAVVTSVIGYPDQIAMKERV